MDQQEILNELQSLIDKNRIKYASPPDLVIRINSVVSDPDSSLGDVVKIVQTSHVLWARLLQIANSALFNLPKQVVSVEDAVRLLGVSHVRNLAVSLSLRDTFNTTVAAEKKRLQNTWRTAVSVGATCFALSLHMRKSKGARVDPQCALLVGLMHSIGDLPLIEYARSRSLDVDQLFSLLGAESRAYLSLVILRKWGLPPNVVEGVSGVGIYSSILSLAQAGGSVHAEELYQQLSLTVKDFADAMSTYEAERLEVLSIFNQ